MNADYNEVCQALISDNPNLKIADVCVCMCVCADACISISAEKNVLTL